MKSFTPFSKVLVPAKLLGTLLILFLALFISVPTHAQVALWTFEVNVVTPATVAANASASNASMGPGVGSVTFYTGYPGRAYAGNNWPSSFSTTDYLEVSVYPDPGYELNLTSFAFDERRSGTGPSSWAIRSSLDGYTTNITSGSLSGTSPHTHTVPLGATFSGVATPVTFRVYGYGASGSSGTWRFDDVTINGTVTAIPAGTACIIDSVGAGAQTPCSTLDNTYTQEITVAWTNGPSTGSLDVNGQLFPLGTSPQTVTLTGLASTGASVDVNVAFSDSSSCIAIVSGLFTAPAPCVLPELVINEIEYDESSTDETEYVELYNYGSSAIDLDPFELVMVNGSGLSIYQTIDLPAYLLGPGEYFVICGDDSHVPNCNLEAGASTNLIQNGSPDAMALRYASTGIQVDAVSYEGIVAGYSEGSSAPTDGGSTYAVGIGRYPDGVDTDDNGNDFSVQCNTPGLPNVSGSSACGPVNDDCVNAIELDINHYEFRSWDMSCNTVVGLNYGGTTELSEPAGSCLGGADHSVWYSFTTPDCVPGNMYLTSDFGGTDLNTTITVYESVSGTCDFTGFSEVACNDDASMGACAAGISGGASSEEFSVAVSGGTVYYVQVEGLNDDRGYFELGLAIEPQSFSLSAGTYAESQIDFSWNTFAGDNLDVFYSPTGYSGYVAKFNRTATANSETANYLMPSTQYQFWGNHSCGAGLDQYWGPVDTLTTAGSICTTPDPLSCGTATSNSITFNWTAGGEPDTRYHVYYRQVGSSGYNVRWNRPGSSYTIYALMPSTSYEIWVVADCAPGVRFTSAILTCSTTSGAPVARLSDKHVNANFTYDGWEYVDYPWNMINIPMPETVSEVVAVDGELMAFDMAGDKVDFSNASEPTVSAFDFELIPNVTTNETSVRFYQATATNANVGVYDLQGKMVYSEDLGEANGFVNHTISTSDMAAGLYHVVVNTADEVMSKKLVIVR